jgi:serine/threonine protein kinase
MAPECFRGVLNAKSDVWACGVFMYIFVTGKFPFMGSTFSDMQREVNSKPVLFTGTPS